ncbi:hypothetical protein V1527DRAFT_480154 [Lipomyces starkeyi]
MPTTKANTSLRISYSSLDLRTSHLTNLSSSTAINKSFPHAYFQENVPRGYLDLTLQPFLPLSVASPDSTTRSCPHSADTSGQDEHPFYVPDSEATISKRNASRSTVSQRSPSTSDDRQTRRESTEDYDSNEDSDDSDASTILPAEAESIIGGSCIPLGLPSHPQDPNNAEHNREEDKSSTDSFRKTIESAQSTVRHSSEGKTDYSHDADDWEPFCRGSQRGSQTISVPWQHIHLASPNLTEKSPSNGFKIFSFSLPFTIPTVPSLPTLQELREIKIGRPSCVNQLKQTIKEPWKGPIVVAYSMGGLIAHGAMQQDPSLFRGLLYVGSPISCVNILGPLRNGENVLLSSKVLSAQQLCFMPLDGRCFVDKTTGEEIRLDYFDVNTWVKYRLSPCAAPPRTGPLNPPHEEDGKRRRPVDHEIGS